MSRPKIVEVEYHLFAKQLQKATDSGHRIEKSDQPAWDEYVETNGVNEVAMASWGRSKFTKTQPVVLTTGNNWEGYYVYSIEDEACLKWTIVDE